ncbi:sensor histidine kinase [Oceanobacillus chungangensis]|uniref:histidine kinase n=1 Tax=Oceanobacillus chungangensis TaxID=1229152 RepID=A0A3D8PUK9_9BACI|nr:HAMP domain-containing sensor histidine kinase [Oceanobacillus chungangensis]RDW19803.1 two-component sensor histidine kinase [Oceanobacillus chungangensis]
MNILQSLMARYLLLILFALVLIPLIPAVYYSSNFLFHNKLYDTQELEELWKRSAAELDGQEVEVIDHRLQSIKNKYPGAEVFWITGQGESRFIGDRLSNIPENWTFADSLDFMEERKFYVDTFLQDREPQDIYTTIALIGNDPNQGIMVLQMALSKTNIGSLDIDYLFIAFFLFVSGAFLVISWFFFINIRKRLIKLELAMSRPGDEGIPDEVVIKKLDEIGRLEGAFNEMVSQLKRSRKSEQKEEHLRKQLIANISHDLRTPLTVMRQHVYSAKHAPSSPKGKESMQIVENKLGDMDKMINNLLSYTLLSAGKHPIDKKETDVLDEVRKAIAEWYPILEEHRFTIDIDLPEKPLIWKVDSIWFKSILDNVIQNVIRHARSGRYIGIKTMERQGSTLIVIKDRGEGFEYESENKGAGIGLSIVSLMMKEMRLELDISTSSTGTCIYVGGKQT